MFEAIAQRRPARLVNVSKRTPARARNLVVMLPGTQRDRPPVVIMTPRSSWWQSTAERGGGLVCWLESLRALLSAPPRCDVVFTANSGHELGHLGLDDFVARRPGWDRPPSDGGVTWIHYGANLDTVGGQLALVSSEHVLREFEQTVLVLSVRPSYSLVQKNVVTRNFMCYN